MTAFACALLLAAAPADWPQWRGPTGDGAVTDPRLPVKWSAAENVAWKVPVPGIGHSSPVIAGGRVFLTACVGEDRLLLAYDAATGAEQWRAAVVAAPVETMHKNNTPASATPVTDGRRVWVTFLDRDRIHVACRSAADGKPVWERSFPGYDSKHGFCGTPVRYEDLLIVNGDSDGDAFLAGLDAATGGVRWRTPRPNRVRSFSVPVFHPVNGSMQMILAGSKCVAGFDPLTGRQVWVADSPTDKFVSTVAVADGLVIATGTSPAAWLAAVRPDGTGNVTGTHLAWTATRGAAYVPSPLAIGSDVFVVADDGQASLRPAKTGAPHWTERLGRHHHASPLLVNGLVYALADDGTTFVVRPGPGFELVGKNPLGEGCHATPAAAGGRLYIRSDKHLWCLASPG